MASRITLVAAVVAVMSVQPTSEKVTVSQSAAAMPALAMKARVALVVLMVMGLSLQVS